jgi:hypothetical protein
MVGGCGGSSHSSSVTTTTTRAAAHPKPPVCVPAAGAVVARAAAVGDGAVKARVTTGNNGSPECHFAARRMLVVVNVDSSPQPYSRLERTIVEDGQQFGTERNFTPPQTVTKLGIDAAWLPDQSKLMTTDGNRLITVTVTWRRTPLRRQLALADATARRYLGPLNRKAAQPTGNQ